jgi:acyl-CoA thioesterase-1
VAFRRADRRVGGLYGLQPAQERLGLRHHERADDRQCLGRLLDLAPQSKAPGAIKLIGYAAKMSTAKSYGWSRAVPVVGILATASAPFSVGASVPHAASTVSGAASTNRSGRPTAPILYALGDSTGSGVGARSGSYVDRVQTRLEASGKKFRLQNLAESGAMIADVVRDQLVQVPVGATGLVLVGAGANDAIAAIDPTAFRRRFETLLAGLRARTSSPIIVSNIPDVSLAPVAALLPSRLALAERIDAYNRVIASIARNYDAVVFDLCALTRRELPRHPEYLSSDGFHPSDRGYEAWADGVWKKLVQLAL